MTVTLSSKFKITKKKKNSKDKIKKKRNGIKLSSLFTTLIVFTSRTTITQSFPKKLNHL